MLIDVRRGVRLGVKPSRASLEVPTPKPEPGTAFPPRRLTLRGQPVFDLNLWCGTCPALFKRMSQPEDADLGYAERQLATGVDTIDSRILRTYGAVLPKSTYTVMLLEIEPQLVTPGDADDYFSHEQVTTWGIDPAEGGPENPGTPYYRTFETPVGSRGHLYEMLVPMVPPGWNDEAQVTDYERQPSDVTGTAVAYSLLDLCQPAIDDDSNDYYEHWVLSHFLLDGHHKVEAAARAGRPVRLLSLVDERISIATPEEVASMTAARRQARKNRV